MSKRKDMTGMERVASVLLNLEDGTAERVLSHMNAGYVRALTRSADSMKPPKEEQFDGALSDFYEAMLNPAKVLAQDPARHIRGLAEAVLGPRALEEVRPSQPIDKIKATQVETLAGLLQEEHPQVASAILSQLPGSNAAAVLTQMPEELRVDIVQRLCNLEKVPQSVISEACAALAAALSDMGGDDDDEEDFDGTSFAASILKELPSDAGDDLLEKIREDSSETAEKIRDAMFGFEDLVGIDKRGLQLLMREVPQTALLPALKTASPELVDALFAVVSSRAAQALREDLQLLRPMRLSEVEDAQSQVLEIARRLAEEGTLALPIGGSEEMV